MLWQDILRGFLLMCIVPVAFLLHCPPCNRIHCRPRKASRLNCKGGITTSICGCCPVCAKIKGQRCGGDFDYLGKCDKGLYCHIQKTKFATRKPDGICEKVPNHIQDAPIPRKKCRPKCTPDFCRKHPKAICSATNVAERTQPCQKSCQHTSCLACRFMAEPECKRCAKDDFRCLRKFGKCIKRQYCTKQKFPCRTKALKNFYVDDSVLEEERKESSNARSQPASDKCIEI